MLLAVLTFLAMSGCGAAQAPSQVTGSIVELRGDGAEISAFTVESDGRRLEVWIADDVEYGFDLEHLQEHADSGDPVRCALEERDGRLYALSIADA